MSFQQQIDQLIQGLKDGTLMVQQIHRQRDIGGVTRIDVEFVDMSTVNALGSGPPLDVFIGMGATPKTTPPSWEELVAKGGMISIAEHRKKMGMKDDPLRDQLVDLGMGTNPIIGFRDFALADSVSGFVLMSRNKTVWKQREKSVAFCNGNIYTPHDAPADKCECGIYAYDLPNHAQLKRTDVVWAEVALWGDVIICESGYRAEFAYPLSLFLKDSGTKGIKYVRDTLEEGYGVPVFLVEEREGKTASQVMGELIARDLNNERHQRISGSFEATMSAEELQALWDANPIEGGPDH